MTQLINLLETVNGSAIVNCPDSKTFVRNAASHGVLTFNARHNGYNTKGLALTGLRMHLRSSKYVGRDFAVMPIDKRFFIFWRVQHA